jgi:hydroxymethylglutaryl-CoA reductase
LNNIINQFQATAEERILIKNHFKDNAVSHAAAVEFIEKLRK